MKKRNRNIFEIRRGILKCKKRLDALKNKGFIFSQDIYDNLDLLEKKIIESSLIRQIWNKKLPLLAGIIIIFSIIMSLNNFYPSLLTDGLVLNETKIKEIMDIAVNNVHDEMVITENITIIGTASYPNGNILSVHVKIDEGIWKNATGTNQWYYQLYIDELSDGNHTLSFRCSDGKDFSITERKILIDKGPITENAPTVTIHYPNNNGDDISGIININGTATAGVGEIQRVEIQFDGSDWITVTGKTTWQYNWDTKTVENGTCYISVRSYDNESQSKINQIIVNVDNPPPEYEVIIPDIEGVNTFQLYIFGSDEVMKPNETYTGQGFHRKKEEIFSRDTLIRLEVTNTYDWLTVSLPDQPIVTPPDYVLYNFSIDISITDDADMNSRGKFTITATYGPRFRFNLDFLLNQDPHDIDFYTGQW
jgi:Bacterial Ig domain